MKKIIYVFIVATVFGGIALVAFSPDTLSLVMTGIMWVIVCAGILVGVIPAISYFSGLQKGMESIRRASEAETGSVWVASQQIEKFFGQRTLDELYEAYRDKVNRQRENGQLMSDIDDYINEEILAISNWNSVMVQIPGTLTGLGILGTFIGLILGITGIGFSSVEAALTSVETLLTGIEIAFYTSIAGVMLSIVFNILYRITWNMMVRELGMFIEAFQKNVVPSVEEQQRYRERKEIQQILERLDRIPKSGGFSLSNGNAAGGAALEGGNEEILMPQIQQGLKDGEFVFLLQPRFDLNNRRVTGAEALVRWNHGKLGTVSPAVFIPVLEKNGYITKLDQYIWEKVCVTIRNWIDAGIRPLPLSVNVSKTDVLAIDIVTFFSEMIKKYRIPPRYLDIEIAQNAYPATHGAMAEVETQLRQSGFRVVLDGFDGNFLALNSGETSHADVWKLDLRYFSQKNQGAIQGVFDQARKLQISLFAEGIENMEQVSALRKSGCTEGQGYYFSRPVSVEEFETMMSGEAGNEKAK